MDQTVFRGRDIVDLAAYSAEEARFILESAAELKAATRAGKAQAVLAGQTLGMIFNKPSNRTRVSFEVGMFQLGGHALYLNPAELQMGVRETVRDVAKVLSRMVNGIMIRTFAHAEVLELARHAEVPVINGLDDTFHPCQALADFLTLSERFGGVDGLRGLTLAYVGDGNNVLHSLAQMAAFCGVNLSAAVPKGFEPDPRIWSAAASDAQKEGATLVLGHDPFAAVRGAQAVYTDVWISMGQEQERESRLRAFQGFQLNADLMACAGPETLIMHCLPAHYGEEITEEVAYGPRSVLFDQAENRLHAQKAVLSLLLGR